jgi:hypothetical protein
VQFEDLRGEFRTLAELVGASFDAIDRRLVETIKSMSVRIDDHHHD